ncbi:hypothetical protein [Nocardiopsis potens]|uniref:hypothetical protein n=1 Tax=Nocardiopsis potens TaxID=1246458 RepID=UPI0012688277|nr:hypothetical protein [Nocardiopsis potens]
MSPVFAGDFHRRRALAADRHLRPLLTEGEAETVIDLLMRLHSEHPDEDIGVVAGVRAAA